MGLKTSFKTAVMQILYGNVNTILPGKIIEVTSIQPLKGVVEIQLDDLKKDGTTEEYPVVKEVPIVLPQYVDCFIKVPKSSLTNVGCIVLVSQRNIDTWKYTGVKQAPKVNTKFDISDMIVIPGLSDFTNINTSIEDNDNFEIGYKDGIIAIEPDGTIDMNNGNFRVTT